MLNIENQILSAVELIKKSGYTTVFTGAGISVESGIPPFRGNDGLWSKYDPRVLDLGYFYTNPLQSWIVIKEIFYDFFGKALPNPAHKVLAHMQSNKLVHSIITQNIDNLHQDAGASGVIEYHGNSQKLISLKTGKIFSVKEVNLEQLPPLCPDGGLLKPNFIFFGENIPQDAYRMSLESAAKSKVLIIIGTTGEVSPANYIPRVAKQHGAKIIEINTEDSLYTNSVTDIMLKGRASEIMLKIESKLFDN